MENEEKRKTESGKCLNQIFSVFHFPFSVSSVVKIKK